MLVKSGDIKGHTELWLLNRARVRNLGRVSNRKVRPRPWRGCFLGALETWLSSSRRTACAFPCVVSLKSRVSGLEQCFCAAVVEVLMCSFSSLSNPALAGAALQWTCWSRAVARPGWPCCVEGASLARLAQWAAQEGKMLLSASLSWSPGRGVECISSTGEHNRQETCARNCRERWIQASRV